MDFVDRYRLNLANAMYKGTIIAANSASEDFAPKGATLQLSRGIRALKPFINSAGDVIGIISSAARNRSGYNYAARQHNEPLLHFGAQPLQRGFGDGQSGTTREKRYAKGYALARRTGSGSRFASEYLTKGVDKNRGLFLSLAAQAVGES